MILKIQGFLNGNSYVSVAISNLEKVIYLFKKGKASLIKDITITSKLCLANILRSSELQPHTTDTADIADTADTTDTTGTDGTTDALSVQKQDGPFQLPGLYHQIMIIIACTCHV